MEAVRRYLMISLGCALFAVGFAVFLDPVDLAPGGVSGIAVIVTHLLPQVDSGTVIFLLNCPLLITGTIVFGGRFFAGTIWATILSSAMISFTEMLLPTAVVTDLYACAILGAVLTGVGIGMVFRGEATTGGTDIVVRLLQRKFHGIRTGWIFLAVDSAVVLASGLVFRNWGILFYSALSLAVNAVVVNLVLDFRQPANSDSAQ